MRDPGSSVALAMLLFITGTACHHEPSCIASSDLGTQQTRVGAHLSSARREIARLDLEGALGQVQLASTGMSELAHDVASFAPQTDAHLQDAVTALRQAEASLDQAHAPAAASSLAEATSDVNEGLGAIAPSRGC